MIGFQPSVWCSSYCNHPPFCIANCKSSSGELGDPHVWDITWYNPEKTMVVYPWNCTSKWRRWLSWLSLVDWYCSAIKKLSSDQKPCWLTIVGGYTSSFWILNWPHVVGTVWFQPSCRFSDISNYHCLLWWASRPPVIHRWSSHVFSLKIWLVFSSHDTGWPFPGQVSSGDAKPLFAAGSSGGDLWDLAI